MARQLFLYADSILRSSASASLGPFTSKRSNSELVASLRSLLESLPSSSDSEDAAACFAWDEGTETLSIPSPDSLEPNNGDDARQDLDVTAKFFFVESETNGRKQSAMPCEWTEAALDALQRATGIDEVDTFILSFPGVVYPEDSANSDGGCSDCDDEGSVVSDALLRRVLDTYEQVASNERIRSLGLADFAFEPLQEFFNRLCPKTRKPRVDQINLRDCCSVSKLLTEFAGKRNVELLTHADCSDLLPPKTFKALLAEARPRLPPSLHPDSFCVRWVLKYTVVHKTRNVVKDKGYVVFADRTTS